ncbi:transposase family protein [Kitasatospora sp. NPDC048540]|uniref:transposase family protein n=1 Tax=Kitasatospora sp. NPDC048540 TaxID=3155634 RepID=UPI0033CF9619
MKLSCGWWPRESSTSNGASVRQPAVSCPCSACGAGVSGAHGFPEVVGVLRDPRKARGRRHPLRAVLLVAPCAMACGFGSFRAMGQWAAAAPQETLVRLGLPARGVFALAGCCPARPPSADRAAVRRPRNSRPTALWSSPRTAGTLPPCPRTASSTLSGSWSLPGASASSAGTLEAVA